MTDSIQSGLLCRICNEPMGSPQGRGKHEANHVKKGEARYVGPKVHGVPRPIEKLNPPYHPVEAEPKGDREFTPYNGKPCEICGAHDFKNQFAFDMHRNYHARKGEATWKHGISKGPDKMLLPTRKGHQRFAGYLESRHDTQAPSGTENAIVPVQPGGQVILTQEQYDALVAQQQSQQVAVGPHECSATNLVKTLRTSLVMIELAAQCQDMDPEQMLQMLGAMKSLRDLPRHGRR